MQFALSGLPTESIEHLIFAIRGRRIIFDADLARIYGISTKALNQAVKRNREKFPEDFMFQLTPGEMEILPRPRSSSATVRNRSQFVTGFQKHRDPRFPPFAFTEHGAIMAANVVNSPRAIQMSVYVIRAFVRMRMALGSSRKLARKLAALEKELKARLDVHEAAIVDILQRIMNLFDPPALPEPKRREIGFHARPQESERANSRKH